MLVCEEKVDDVSAGMGALMDCVRFECVSVGRGHTMPITSCAASADAQARATSSNQETLQTRSHLLYAFVADVAFAFIPMLDDFGGTSSDSSS